MRIYRALDRYPPDAPPSVVAQGTFDGVHLGHQAVVRTAVDRGRALGARTVALTFDPLPATVLRPAEASPEILPIEERLEQILAIGADAVVVIPFTPEFSRLEAEAFVAEILRGVLKAQEVVVGFNHRFGRGARGTPAVLEQVAAPLGLRVHVVPPHRIDGALVSSSAVREALKAGDVGRAARLLGRPHAIRGRVSRGAQRGRLLGFPTANLVPSGQWLLAPGVYAGRASWEDSEAAAVINVGVRPTFGETGLVAEAHLLDVSPDLYDRVLTIAFLARIRDEMRFGSIDALRARIQEDVAAGRRLLAVPPAP
jgi:riboflavin kinase/FMN adenylyltransferase